MQFRWLTDLAAVMVYSLKMSGLSYAEIADRTNLSAGLMGKIARKESHGLATTTVEALARAVADRYEELNPEEVGREQKKRTRRKV